MEAGAPRRLPCQFAACVAHDEAHLTNDPLLQPALTGVLASARSDAPCDLAALAHFRDSALDTVAGLGGAMKLRQPREATPLMVWIALALMAIAAVAYLAGILIMEDILALFRAGK